MLNAQKLSYTNEKLSNVLEELASKTKLSFNYDPSLLEGYAFDGTIDLKDIKNSLSSVFYDTPLTYEVLGDNILIIKTEKINYKICGWVQDKSYGTNLLSANVYAEGIDIGTLTDESGYFEIDLQAYKNQKVNISYIGYVSEEIMVGDFADGECKEFHLLNDKELLGSEIVIKDYILKGVTEGKSYNSTSINIAKTIDETGNDEHDILKTVQILPGITSLDESAGNLNIRGSTPHQNMLVWERATLYDSGHLFGMISTVNPFVLDKVNIYKGVFDPSYDNRIGGLIEMSLPDEIPNKISGGIGSTLSEAHAHLQLPILKDKLGVIISTRNSVDNIINSPTINSYTDKIFQLTKLDTEISPEEEEYRDSEEDISFFDNNIKLFYKHSHKLMLKSSLLLSDNSFNSYTLNGNLETQDELLEQTWAFSNELSYLWNKDFRTTLFLVDSDYKFEYFSQAYDLDNIFLDEDEELEEFEDDLEAEWSNKVQNNINDLSIGLSNELKFNHKSNLKVDLSVDVKDVKYLYEEKTAYGDDFFDDGFENGVFSNLSFAYDYKADKLQFMLGSKATYYHQIDQPFFSPRMSLQYLVKKDVKIKFSTGKMYQFISQVTLNEANDLSALSNFWVMANETSDEVMQSDKISAGIISNQNGWLIDVEAYYNKNNGLSSLSANLNAGVDLEENGESTAKGIELLIKKSYSNYTMWLNYTLSDNKYYFPDTDMDLFPANNDHRHNLSLVNSYKYKDFTFTLNYNFRSGLPYSQPYGLVSTEYDDYIDYTLGFDELNNYRLDSYHRFDASMTYSRPIYNNKLKAEFNLSMVNILDSRNVYSRDSYLINDEANIDRPIIQSFDKYLLRRTPKFLFRVYW